MRKIVVGSENPFLVAYQKGEKEDIELIKQSPWSPVYYSDYFDYIGDSYVIAIINEFFEIQYFNKNTFNFLVNIVNKLRKEKLKINKNYAPELLTELNLEKHNLEASDIEYLTSFDLTYLRILDLNNNSINPKGAFFLSQAKFNSLQFLNLSYNKIGDEGLKHISKGAFSKLNSLHLSRNYITSLGIYYLVTSDFTNNLIALSLSDNRKIGDTGMRRLKEHKWKNIKDGEN